jgi:hypothetical protein
VSFLFVFRRRGLCSSNPSYDRQRSTPFYARKYLPRRAAEKQKE